MEQYEYEQYIRDQEDEERAHLAAEGAAAAAEAEVKMVTRILKLIIPLTPCSLNKWQRAHWAKRRRIQDEWDMEVVKALAQVGEGARLVRLFERARVRIRYYFRTKHKRDKDNFVPKVIMDCLKGRVIVDDSSDRVDVDWELLYDSNARTEIVIEEVEE